MILYVILILALSAALFEGWEIYSKRKRIKKLKKELQSNKCKGNGLLVIAEKLLGWYSSKNKLYYRLSRAGNPKYIGTTPAHFYAAKLFLTVFCAFFIGKSGMPLFLYGIGGFFIPDILIWLGGKKRQERILNELPEMIDFLKKSLASGIQMPEAFASLTMRVKGPLQEEVIRLSAHYNLTMDLEGTLNEFSKRVELDAVDNMILALKQGEHTGKVKTLLGQQSEMLKTSLQHDQKKSTQNQANLLPLVSVLMVVNILVLVAAPLAIKFMGNSFFN